MILGLDAFNEFITFVENQNIEKQADLFHIIVEKYKLLFCEEFGLLPEWLDSYRLEQGFIGEQLTPAISGQNNFVGDYVDGVYLQLKSQQVGGYCYTSIIEDIIVKNGLLDFNTATKMAVKLSNNYIKQIRGEYVMKSNKEQDGIFNSDAYHFDNHNDKVILGFDNGTDKEEKEPKESEQHYRTSFDNGRLEKYETPMGKATVGDVAKAFGEAYHEVSNKLRVDDEDMQMLKSFGVKRQYLSDVSESYGVFYIPLVLQATQAVINDELVLEQKLNWRWGEPKPVGYGMFDVALNKKIRLMHTGVYLCHDKNNDAKKVWIHVKMESTMNGPVVNLKIITKASDIDFATRIKKDIDTWKKENNYLKNKKIDGNGLFLDVAKYSWDDVVIDADIKDQIFQDVVGFLNYKDLYIKNGLPLKRGIILHGKPGCGKTLLGKVIANEIETTFVWLTSAQVGNAGVIRSVFKLARELSPCVLFFEDIDMYTVGRHYGSFSPLVGELLAQMDGMEENDGIITIATTNRLDVIEGALATRPSRFDRRFNLDAMLPETRRRMVEVKLGKAKLVGVTIDEIANMLAGLNGSFIQEVIISAKRKAIASGLINTDGIVLLDNAIITESVREVSNSFKIMTDKLATGDYKEYISGDVDKTKDPISSSPYADMTALKENIIVMSKEQVSPKVEKIMKTTIKPRNVNLTENEKDEVDGEVQKALLMIAEGNSSKDKKSALDIYLKNSGYESVAKALFGQPIDKIDWRKQTKSNLRIMFRMLVLTRNVRRAQGNDKNDPLQKLSFISDLLNAMDLRSDRYYWVHALTRIEQEFGRKVNLPFNPYADQTSKDAALKLLKILIGKAKQRKDKDDAINKKNGVFVPEKSKDTKNPSLQFNEPKVPGNIVQPPVHMK